MENRAASYDETTSISLKLGHYDDIFSDFDVRPYSARALSVDFLDEIKRAARDKDDSGIELVFHVPAAERDETKETVIKERLLSHFRRHLQLQKNEKKHVLKLGMSMVIIGIICMIAATFILFEDPSKNLLLSFLVIFLEPAAWFLLWEGMDQIIFNSKNINPDLEFYSKMTHAHGSIIFRSMVES